MSDHVSEAEDYDHVSTQKENWVWHYTTRQSLPLIVSSHTFRLTSVRSLNDDAEIKLGHRRMRKTLNSLPHWHPDDPWSTDEIERLKNFRSEVEGAGFNGSAFVLSCSRRGDDNAQWQRYAGWDGFAIALPQGVHMPVIGKEPLARTPGYLEEFPLRWLPLAYKKRDQVAVAEKGWGRVSAQFLEQDNAPSEWDYGNFFYDRAVSEYVEAVAAIKSKGYESEREIRYAVKYPDDPAAVHVRSVGNQGATAEYISVTGLSGDRFHSVEQEAQFYQGSPAPLPILAIRVGPHAHYPSYGPATRKLLDDNGYADVRVLRSKSTQRR